MRTMAAIQAEPNNAPRAHNLATEVVAAASKRPMALNGRVGDDVLKEQ